MIELREAAYTPPSGTRLTFMYEDVGRESDKKTAAFIYPDSDGATIQDRGVGVRRYPLRIFFTDHVAADAFYAALEETGRGLLEHPRYGRRNVVPFGTLTQRDNLKTETNQSVIDVTFWDDAGTTYPSVQSDPAQQVAQATVLFNDAQAESLLENMPTDQAQIASFKGYYSTAVGYIDEVLRPIAAATDAVYQRYNDINLAIESGLNTIVGDPLTLALQTAALIQLPAQAAANVNEKLNGYALILERITEVFTGGEDEFLAADMLGAFATSGQILAAVNSTFTTRPEALAAAESILDTFDTWNNWRDLNSTQNDVSDVYETLQDAAAICAGFLVSISFTLKQERRLTLDRARNFIEVSADLYGSIDEEVLNFLITSNNLGGDELLLIPRGREIVYYV